MKAIWPCNFMTSQLNKMTPENDQIKRGGICSVLFWWMFSCTSLNFGFLTWLWGSPLGSPSSDPPAPAAPSGLVQACRRRWSACSAAGGKSRVQMEKKKPKKTSRFHWEILRNYTNMKGKKTKRQTQITLVFINRGLLQNCLLSHTHTHTHSYTHTHSQKVHVRAQTQSLEKLRGCCAER